MACLRSVLWLKLLDDRGVVSIRFFLAPGSFLRPQVFGNQSDIGSPGVLVRLHIIRRRLITLVSATTDMDRLRLPFIQLNTGGLKLYPGPNTLLFAPSPWSHQCKSNLTGKTDSEQQLPTSTSVRTLNAAIFSAKCLQSERALGVDQ